MSTPNPLVPQGSIQPQGGSNVRIAVATVVAIHVVFFGGLLLQGCKRDTQTAEDPAPATNTPAADPLSYPPLETASAADTNSLYYNNPSSLPAAAPATNTGLAGSNPGPSPGASPLDTAFQSATAPAADPWKQAPAAANVPGGAETLGGKEYTVQRGDSYTRIAKTQGSTVSAIRQANPNVDPNRIRPGMKLVVPTIAPSAAAPAGTANGGAGAAANTYTVKSGDNLTRIAKNHGITVGQLREANDLRTSRVNVGQKLKIPAKAAAPARASQPELPATNPTF